MKSAMRSMGVIIHREFSSYFATPLALVFIVVFLFATGSSTFYIGGWYRAGQADLIGFFTFHPWIYLFFLPAISMRLWSEERRNGSIELLLTLPVSLSVIVIGKYLAALAFAALALMLTFPMWLTVNYLGDPDNGVILTGYVGSLMMAGGYLAIGSCMSALTRSQVIAFVISVIVCFLFTVPGATLITDAFHNLNVPDLLVEVLSSLSFLTHFQTIVTGVIDLRNVIFFMSLIAAFLVATIIIVDMKKGESL